MRPTTSAALGGLIALALALAPRAAAAQEQDLAQLRAAATDPAGQVRLGRALRRAGRFDEALRALAAPARAPATRLDAQWEIARVRFDQRDFRASRAACNALPAGVHRHACTARAHLVWNRVALAEQSIQAARAMEANHGELQLAIGDARRLASDVPAAETAYRAAAGTLTGRAEPYLGLGALHEMVRRGDEALADYRRAVEVDPGDPAAALALGRLLLRRGEASEALPHLRRAAEGRTRWAEALAALGEAQLATGDATSALASLQAAVAIAPTLPGVQTALGRALVAAGRHADAEAPLRLAITQVQNDAEAHIALADVLEHTGREPEALETWDAAIDRAPSDLRPHLRAAQLAHRLHQNAVARAHLARLQEIDANYAPAFALLGDIAFAEGNRPLATQLYTSALNGRGDVDRARIQQRLAELAAPAPRPRRR